MKNLLLLLLLPLCQISFAQTNLVKNGGFETEILNWRGEVATVSKFDKKSGNSSAIITQYVGEEWKAIDQIVSIPKNTVAIEFSGWVKSDAIEKGKNEWNTGKFDVELMTSGEKNIKNESIASVLGTTPWTFYKKVILLPEKCAKFRIMLALGQANGSILFDEIKATAINEEDYLKIMQAEAASARKDAIAKSLAPKPFLNGNFEDEFKNWNGSGNLSTSDKKEGSAAIAIQSSVEQWTGIDQVASVPDGVKTIAVSGWLKANAIKPGKDSWNNGVFILELTKEDKSKATEDQLIGSVTGNSEWTEFKKQFPIPEGTKNFRIMLALSACTGTLLADDIQIKLVK